MSKVDWSKAPEGAEFYSLHRFCKIVDGVVLFYNERWRPSMNQDVCLLRSSDDYEPRPQQWPESEERVNIIGQNGNDGLVYEQKRNKYERPIIGLDGTKDNG